MRNGEIEPIEKNLVAARCERNLFLWNPKPLSAPEVEPDLTDMHPVVRSAEVLRYSLHRLEHWVSPNGVLREWLRLNILVALLVGITGLLIGPVVAMLLGQAAVWVELVVKILTGLVSIGLLAVFALVLLRVLQTFKSQSGTRRRDRF